ncbi:MAG: hypothetical protein HC859_15100 [Bacteroidia bacterium]|nr:hypothetical protein [Bacteroidia bacterium]
MLYASWSLAIVPLDTTKRNKVIVLDPKLIHLEEIGSIPAQAKEASGLEITGSGLMWTHNDGGVPVLFGLDREGKLVRTVHINVRNRGWEDLAQDDQGNFYIGSFGNNTNRRKDLRIFKIMNPDSVKTNIIGAEIIAFTYEDQKEFPPPRNEQNFDMDAFIYLNGDLLLFSKNRTAPFTGMTKVYKLSTEPGTQVATLYDAIFLGGIEPPAMNYWITGADISPDKKTIALLGHHRLWLVRNFEGKKFSEGTVYEIDLGHFSHKAGICFSDNTTLYIVDEVEMEIVGGKLYKLDLAPALKVVE